MAATLTFQNTPRRMTRAQRLAVVREHLRQDPDATGFAESLHLLDEIRICGGSVLVEWTDRATPTTLDPATRILGQREHWAYDPTPVGAWGAGPKELAAAWPHCVQIKPKDGKTEPLWFGNGHHVPSVARPVSNEQERRAREKRRRLWRQETETVIDCTAGLKRVVWSEDWNASPDYVDVDMLRKAGFRIVQPRGRLVSKIDWFAVRGVEVEECLFLAKNGSDHPGILVRVS